VRSDTLRLLLLLGVKFVLLLGMPFAAYAAEQTILRQTNMASITVLTWFFLWLFSTGGWAIVHLDALADWFASAKDLSHELRKALWRERLKIIKNYIASLSAGGGFYMLAVSVPSWMGLTLQLPEMVILVGVVPASMGGTMTWDKIKGRFGL
jgi:hypothetical protein